MSHRTILRAQAIPEFYGFGSVTRGALDFPGGPATYHVTNLNDSGPGSLRDALSVAGRLIVFDVAGTITLASTLNIRRSFFTIDGLSAPPPGITIISPMAAFSFNIEPQASPGPISDFIIRGLRFDWQSEGWHGGGRSGEMLALTGGSIGISRFIIDRCTCLGSADGICDMFGQVLDGTISRILYGRTQTAMNCIGGAAAVRPRERISLAHGVWTHNTDRQPRLRAHCWDFDVVNHVIFGWGWHFGMTGSTIFAPRDLGIGELDDVKANFEDNWCRFVPASQMPTTASSGLPLSPGPGGDDHCIRAASDGTHIGAGCEVYLAGNTLPAGEGATSTGARREIPEYAVVPRMAPQAVLANVGCPFRTGGDNALLDEIAAAM